MSSFCAMCGRPRSGTARFCDGCGAEFTDPPPAQDDVGAPTVDAARLGPPPDATRADPAVGATRLDLPGTEPDPFASWYQPERQDGGPGAVPGPADESWANESWADGTWQPTQTVGAAPTRPTGFPPPPPAQPAPPPPPAMRPSRRGRGGMFVALAAIVVLAAGGGAYAVANSFGKHSTTPPPPQPSTGRATPAGSATSAGGSSPSGGPTQSTTPAGSPTPSPSPSPSLSLVSAGPGVTSSAAEPQVETLLSHYFHGINSRDYAEYASTLNPAERAKQTRSTFDSGYATTADSAMTLTALASDGAGGLVATVTFTSHQSPAQSVDHSACNTWTLNFYLVPQGTGYLIGPAPSGYQPSHGDC